MLLMKFTLDYNIAKKNGVINLLTSTPMVRDEGTALDKGIENYQVYIVVYRSIFIIYHFIIGNHTTTEEMVEENYTPFKLYCLNTFYWYISNQCSQLALKKETREPPLYNKNMNTRKLNTYSPK